MYEATFGGPVDETAFVVFRRDAHQERRDRANDGGHEHSVPPCQRRKALRRASSRSRLVPDHSFQASYIAIDQVQTNFSPSSCSCHGSGEPDAAAPAVRSAVAAIYAARCRHIFRSRCSTQRGTSPSTAGHPRATRLTARCWSTPRRNNRYWSPTFCGVCEDEKRDNDNFLVKGSYFVSGRGPGSHHVVFGYDRFNDKIFQNAYASGSDYRIQGTTAIRHAGRPGVSRVSAEHDADHVDARRRRPAAARTCGCIRCSSTTRGGRTGI